MVLFKITLVMWIVNLSVPIKEQVPFVNILKQYAGYVGIEVNVNVKPLKDRYCERLALWEDRYNQYNCYKRYVRDKKGQWNMFIRVPYITNGARLGGGLGAICIKNHHKGLALVAYRSEQSLSSAITGVHEFYHNAGAEHSEKNKNSVMYPYFNSVTINNNGGAIVEDLTKQQIGECLK